MNPEACRTLVRPKFPDTTVSLNVSASKYGVKPLTSAGGDRYLQAFPQVFVRDNLVNYSRGYPAPMIVSKI